MVVNAPGSEQQPLLVGIVGPASVARSTFLRDFTRANQLPFVDANLIADAHKANAAEAARLARELCDHYNARAESFVLVTALSDPAGETVEYFHRMWIRGYRVALCFVGLNCSQEEDAGAALPTAGGGYDLSVAELFALHPHTLDNLARAREVLPCVLLYDNSGPAQQLSLVAEYREGRQTRVGEELPAWFDAFTKQQRTS